MIIFADSQSYSFLDHKSIVSRLEYEIVIVEDNSPDGTLHAAQEMKRLYGSEKILIISRAGKLGLGSAYIVSW
jgi:dolichol-phosphate mannosyltransferase